MSKVCKNYPVKKKIPDEESNSYKNITSSKIMNVRKAVGISLWLEGMLCVVKWQETRLESWPLRL